MATAQAFAEDIKARALLRNTPEQPITRKNSEGNSLPMEWIFDFRAIMLEPQWLNTYAELFWQKNERHLPFQIGGLESAAIPLISAIVMKGHERGTPVSGFYIRKSRKREGLMKMVEGTLTKDPIILVDDLINSGGTFLKQMVILKELGAKVKSIFTIVAFHPIESYSAIKEAGVDLESLYTLEDFDLPEKSAFVEQKISMKPIWKHSAGMPAFDYVVHKSSPAILGDFVYVGSDHGRFFCLNSNTGEEVWTFDVGKHPAGKGIFSSPAVHDDTVYFGAYDGEVYALDATSGTIRWKYSDADWVGSSPALSPQLGMVFIGLEFGLFKKRGGIVALDVISGKRIWQDKTPALTHGSPCFIPQKNLVVIGSNDGIVYAYDAKSGTRLWHYQTGGDIKMAPAYDAKLDLILVASMDTKVYALTSRGEPNFAAHTGGNLYCTPLIHEGYCYVSSMDKHIYAISLETGKMAHSFETGGRMFSSAIVADGSLWVGSNDGCLYELEPITLKKKGFFQASERFVGKPAFDAKSRHIIATTVANETYCLERL